jgi:hypothetical protein
VKDSMAETVLLESSSISFSSLNMGMTNENIIIRK